MRVLSSEVQAALAAGALVPRDFLWITARNRTTGAPQTWGGWSDVGTVTADVIDWETGTTLTRTFEGAGELIEISPISLVTGLTVQSVEIHLSQLALGPQNLVLGYDVRRAPVELHRGFLDPATYRLVAPAVPRFVGFVDEAPITTPAEGQEGGIRLVCVSQTQELTRRSSATRSDADQRRRNPADGFFRHAATVGTWKIWWGQRAE